MNISIQHLTGAPRADSEIVVLRNSGNHLIITNPLASIPHLIELKLPEQKSTNP